MKNRILQTLFIGLFSLMSIVASAQGTYTFNNTTGDGLWTTAANWTGGARPPYITITADNITIAANCNNSITGELPVLGRLTVNAGVSLTFTTGGTIFIRAGGNLDVNGVILTPSVDNYGTTTISGTETNPARLITQYPGFLNEVGATLNINNKGTLEYRQDITGSIIPNGTVNWNAGGAFAIGSGNTFTLLSDFTVSSGKKLEILGNMIVNSGVTLTNNGTINVHSITNNGTIVNNGLMPTTTFGTIFNNGIFSGSGSQGCSMQNNGILKPGGDYTGCYLFSGGFGFGSGGSINMDINGTAPCLTAGHDQVVVAGVVNVAGILNLNFGSYAPPIGTTFQLFQVTGGGTTYTGNFSAINRTPNTISVSYDRFSGVLTISDPCPPPTSLNYGVAEVDKVSLSWSPVSGTTGYEVQYKKQSLTTWTTAPTTTNTNIELTNLDGRTLYDVRVRAICSPTSRSATWTETGFQTAHGTKQNGNWNNPNTWYANQIPTAIDIAYVRNVVTVNTPTAQCLNLFAQNAVLIIGTGNSLKVGDIDLVQNSGGSSIAKFETSNFYLEGGSLNVGGQLYFGQNSGVYVSSGTVNINGNGDTGPQSQGFSISTSSLYIDDFADTQGMWGGTFHIFPPSFFNPSLIIETNKELGDFNNCRGSTFILETGGEYNLGGTNLTTTIAYHPQFYNLILRGTTNMDATTVKNDLTVDGVTLNLTGASTFGTLTQLNGGTVPTGAGTHTEVGACQLVPIISVADGLWSDRSTWSGFEVPTAMDNVIIAHTVTHGGSNVSYGICKNLTINSGATLNQANLLTIFGNLLIQPNGTFNNISNALTYTALRFNGISQAASEAVHTINGTLHIRDNIDAFEKFEGAGRFIFNNGSTLTLDNNAKMKLWGWSGSTPQYLMDIDHLSNLSLGENCVINVANIDINQRILSPNHNFTRDCSVSLDNLFQLSRSSGTGTATFDFGGGTQVQSIKSLLSD